MSNFFIRLNLSILTLIISNEEIFGENLIKDIIDSLRILIERLHKEYSKKIPIYVTENGMANKDVIMDGKINDTKRIKFYNDHLIECFKLLQNGIPLKGYFAWSLLDNFEWAYGYSKRFGLVYVDFDNLTRVPKLSWEEFRKYLKS